MKFKFVIRDKNIISEISTVSGVREHYVLALKLINLVQKKRDDIYHLSDIKNTFKTYIRLVHNLKLNEALSLENEAFPSTLRLEYNSKNNESAIVTMHLSVLI
jgi:hypothetical protein